MTKKEIQTKNDKNDNNYVKWEEQGSVEHLEYVHKKWYVHEFEESKWLMKWVQR